jgi:hypothetical protein
VLLLLGPIPIRRNAFLQLDCPNSSPPSAPTLGTRVRVGVRVGTGAGAGASSNNARRSVLRVHRATITHNATLLSTATSSSSSSISTSRCRRRSNTRPSLSFRRRIVAIRLRARLGSRGHNFRCLTHQLLLQLGQLAARTLAGLTTLLAALQCSAVPSAGSLTGHSRRCRHRRRRRRRRRITRAASTMVLFSLDHVIIILYRWAL